MDEIGEVRRIGGRLFSTILIATALTAAVPRQDRASRTADVDLATLLDRVAERVNKYYVDLQKFAWTNTVRQQALRADRTPADKARELVYEGIVRLDPAAPRTDGIVPPPFYTKDLSELVLVDGKPVEQGHAPVPRDLNAGNTGLLWSLLGQFKNRSRFSHAGQANLDGRRVFLLDHKYSPGVAIVGPFDLSEHYTKQVSWQGDSFLLTDVRQTGRFWIDAVTYDVLRLETKTKPIEFEKPGQRGKLTFETQTSARFQSITFENPSQTLMVPESIETVRTIKGRQPPILRTVHSFANYRRFAGDIQITPIKGLPR